MTACPTTLTKLAQRFDAIAAHSQGHNRLRAQRNASQLRLVAQLVLSGTYTTEQGWQWADAAAGQLINDKRQLDKKARTR